MNTEQNDTNLDKRLCTLERLLVGIDQKLDRELAESASIGDWVKEQDVMRITGLGKTTLYNLRKTGRVTSSTIAERGVFYKLKDFEKLLNRNEKER